MALIERGLSGVRAVQPIVQEMVMSSMKAAVAGRLVSITFDGSKDNFAIERASSMMTTCPPCARPSE